MIFSNIFNLLVLFKQGKEIFIKTLFSIRSGDWELIYHCEDRSLWNCLI